MRIKELRAAFDLSQADLAKSLGMSPAAVAQWELNKTKPGFESRAKIEAKYGWSAKWIETGKGLRVARKLVDHLGKVPVVDFATLADVDLSQDFQPAKMATTWMTCPVEYGPRSFAFRQHGDSMTSSVIGRKSYPPGCLVYADPDKTNPRHDTPIIARLSTGNLEFCLYMNQAGRVWLDFLNDRYDPIKDELFDVVACVIGKWEDS